MNSQISKHLPDRSDTAVLRTFALLLGILLTAGGLAILAGNWLWNGAMARAIPAGYGTPAAAIALVIGAALAYWGVRRRYRADSLSEEALSKLIQKYERKGKTKELAEARERLIQLLIDKDENEASGKDA